MIVGIDLGTTNSLVGVYDSGFVSLVGDASGQRLTPSQVYYPTAGAPLVGSQAARMRAIAPERTVFSVKRFIGARVGEVPESMPYKVSGPQGGAVQIQIGDASYSPEQVSSEILAKLKADAEHSLGISISKAVVTVPAYFNDAQRTATKRAGELAGLEVVRILNEPTAAALAYGMDRRAEHTKVAVYDFGGGTFDVSILELTGGVFQVLSTNGNTRLGGDDIDTALVGHLMKELGIEALDPVSKARLLEAAVEAKHRLSDLDETVVSLPFVEHGLSREVPLSRGTLEELARPLVAKTRVHCLRALADANLAAEDINELIMVGGSTRMPLVRKIAGEIFGRVPNTSRNPDEAVAEGAALQAAILDGTLTNVVLLDVTPLSLGIETFGGLMNVILPRNSTIPCKAGEMFTNAVPGQRSMLIRVLQGERELAADNWELGRFEIPFQPARKGQARVGVQFEIDANGILSVLARDTSTGVEEVVKMSSAVEVSDEAVEKMLGDALDNAFEDMNARAFTEARLKAEEMLPSVQKALSLVAHRLEEAELARIRACEEDVRSAMSEGGAPALKRAVGALDEATQGLAAMVVEAAMAGTGRRKD